MEHVNKFIDSMGPFAGDRELCLREFSKSLTDRAYTWYSTLQPNSIPTWEDMVEGFCTKYFHGEEMVTIIPFTIRNKSLQKGSLILLDDSEIPPSIVMDSTKSKNQQKFASTTCSRNTEHTWRTLTFTNLPNYSKKLIRQPHQLSHLSLTSLEQKKETPLKLLPSPVESQQQG